MAESEIYRGIEDGHERFSGPDAERSSFSFSLLGLSHLGWSVLLVSQAWWREMGSSCFVVDGLVQSLRANWWHAFDRVCFVAGRFGEDGVDHVSLNTI